MRMPSGEVERKNKAGQRQNTEKHSKSNDEDSSCFPNVQRAGVGGRPVPVGMQ